MTSKGVSRNHLLSMLLFIARVRGPQCDRTLTPAQGVQTLVAPDNTYQVSTEINELTTNGIICALYRFNLGLTTYNKIT